MPCNVQVGLKSGFGLLNETSIIVGLQPGPQQVVVAGGVSLNMTSVTDACPVLNQFCLVNSYVNTNGQYISVNTGNVLDIDGQAF